MRKRTPDHLEALEEETGRCRSCITDALGQCKGPALLTSAVVPGPIRKQRAYPEEALKATLNGDGA
jgi:hypothetical protein